MSPAPPPLPIDLVRQITALAARFDEAWRAGVPPALESLLEQVPEQGRPELLRQLLRLECDFRQHQGRPLTVAEARERFAALGPWAAPVLANLGLEDEPLTLEITTGPHVGRTFQLAGHATCLVGRGPTGVNLAVENDVGMSRVHFRIEYNPPVARAADMRSKNGVYLNGTKIDEADLADDDELYAGQTTLRVRFPRVAHTVTTAGRDAPDATRFTTIHRPPLVPGYEILDEIGRGGMGVVYKARRTEDGQLVAIKAVLPAVLPRPEVVGRFSREMAILQSLTHPNVVAFHHTGESGSLLYFVMEYVEGESAAKLVKRLGPFSPARVVTLGCQLLGALAHAHLQGIVHRDVKPANVLLTTVDGRETLKLADFGLARAYQASAMSGLTMTGTPGGTPGFMPPEQVLDFRNARPAADQYAAAATLYFLLTGKMIYEPTATTTDLMMRVLNDEPIPLRPQSPPLPPSLAEVIRRALARDVRHRFPDVLAMREALAKGERSDRGA